MFHYKVKRLFNYYKVKRGSRYIMFHYKVKRGLS